jgi:hypothetical protein
MCHFLQPSFRTCRSCQNQDQQQEHGVHMSISQISCVQLLPTSQSRHAFLFFDFMVVADSHACSMPTISFLGTVLLSRSHVSEVICQWSILSRSWCCGSSRASSSFFSHCCFLFNVVAGTLTCPCCSQLHLERLLYIPGRYHMRHYLQTAVQYHESKRTIGYYDSHRAAIGMEASISSRWFCTRRLPQ